MKRVRILLLAAMALFASAGIASPGQTMRKAAEVYQQGDTDRAIRLWEGLREEGYISAPLFYNLGNAYFQKGDLSRAILNYERGLLIQPGNKKIRHNLNIVNARVEGSPISWPSMLPLQIWGTVRGVFPANTWAVCAMGGAWAALACWLLSRRRKKSGIWRLGSASLALIAVLAALLSFSAARALSSTFAIVMEKELVVQVGPDLQSGRAATVYEGWKLMRLDQIGSWVKVELPGGEEGWIPQASLEEL